MRHLLLLLVALLSPVALAAGQYWHIVYSSHAISNTSMHGLALKRMVVYCSSRKPTTADRFLVTFDVVNAGSRTVGILNFYLVVKPPSGGEVKFAVREYVGLELSPGEVFTYTTSAFSLSDVIDEVKPGVWVFRAAYSTAGYSGAPRQWPEAEVEVYRLPGSALDVSIPQGGVHLLSTVVAGIPVQVEVEVANTGEELVSSAEVGCWVNGTLVGSANVTGIQPGDIGKVRLQWKPSSPGSYLLEVKVDPRDLIRELDEGNNEFTEIVRARAPDLAISDIRLPASMIAGKPAEASVIVANMGDYRSPATRLIVEYPGGGGEFTIGELEPGESTSVSFKVGFSSPGVYPVRAEVNPGRSFIEWSLENNRLEKRVTVAAEVEERVELKPDLRVKPGGLKLLTLEPKAGMVVEIAAQVENAGDAESKSFLVALMAGGEKVDAEAVAFLPVDSERTVKLSWKPLNPGEYTLEVIVDYRNEVVEWDEENNRAALRVRVEPEPTPVVSSEEPEATLTPTPTPEPSGGKPIAMLATLAAAIAAAIAVAVLASRRAGKRVKKRKSKYRLG